MAAELGGQWSAGAGLIAMAAWRAGAGSGIPERQRCIRRVRKVVTCLAELQRQSRRQQRASGCTSGASIVGDHVANSAIQMTVMRMWTAGTARAAYSTASPVTWSSMRLPVAAIGRAMFLASRAAWLHQRPPPPQTQAQLQQILPQSWIWTGRTVRTTRDWATNVSTFGNARQLII